ncbi:pentatricopeptide repeat-containing protein mitochondrial [Dorcoceras hygrometricum]|uniref:Pentatricopeptide repeat-containing protein mitochondrial n=1 Tax=Dorcoceras hygrometricum TaxID=472368 RepID=A0A2Z7AHX7_9LAMI|nr:pentatricopeptide repeat-containing protein mitochondrial [Dorcoceras hygrometricum]
MAAALVTAPAPPTSAPHNHRLHHLLTQNDSINIRCVKQIHARILRATPPPESNTETLFLYSRLVHHYSLQDLRCTFHLLSQIPDPNAFIYNTVIRAYARSKDQKRKAFCLFEEMVKLDGVVPDKHTFPFVLKACAYLFSLSEGKQAHAHLLKYGFASDVYINNSLIHFYASCGCSESARKVFDKMQERSLVSWNVIIDALVQMGEFEEALKFFVEMNQAFEPDGYTLQSVIDACAGLGALSLGLWVHAYILRKYSIDSEFDVLINNSLVEMYCKCGLLRIAEQVFQGMIRRDVNSWNVMILGFAMHGEAERVFEHFSGMVDEGKMLPNSITFVGVLTACNHRGLVDVGRRYFDAMVNEHKIEPVLQHYGCLIDLLARNGLISEALDVVASMKMKPDNVIWRSLLDASCRQSINTELIEPIAKQIVGSVEDGWSSGEYVILSRLYASADRWNEVGLVRKLMTDKGVTKEPGCTSIEIDGTVHEFFAGDVTHPRKKEIYQFLDVVNEKLESEGYVPDCAQASMVNELDDEKGKSLGLHSERLAIAFGLLNSKPGIPIRVFKNLRVCKDCHNFTKLVSRIFKVEVVMRDRVRFHHFRDDGMCSCKDFW